MGSVRVLALLVEAVRGFGFARLDEEPDFLLDAFDCVLTVCFSKEAESLSSFEDP